MPTGTATDRPAAVTVSRGRERQNRIDAQTPLGSPRPMTYVLLLIAITAEVIATSALKAAEGFSKPVPSVIVVVGYAVAFYCLSLTLKVLPVGIAYAIWSGVGIVLVAAIGLVVYGQKLDLPAVIGLGLIIAGVLVVNLLSKSVPH
jgi:small multidrug resistance pump